MRNEVEPDITIIVHLDDMPVRGNACASGDDAFDKKVEDAILRRLDSGDVWAWACVEVRASFAGLSASDFLGGCSCEDVNDFIAGGYFEDMVAEACTDLAEQIEGLQGVHLKAPEGPPETIGLKYAP